MARQSGKHHTSSNSDKDPYLKLTFWLNPANQFWNNSGLYSEKTRAYYTEWLARWIRAEKYLPNVDSNLN